ncbi:hypothetical protein [Variovorax atrisoli]|uniref:hypothetical protein n=1 Tax=Variovorax atrisoli TaxID=3394203 RepID=UPI00404021D2
MINSDNCRQLDGVFCPPTAALEAAFLWVLARYDHLMTTLYLQMTDKLSAHWRAHNNAYPRKFVLSPALRDEYLKCLSWVTDARVRVTTIPEKHMGVPIEIDEASPGVMVAADGTEVALQ